MNYLKSFNLFESSNTVSLNPFRQAIFVVGEDPYPVIDDILANQETLRNTVYGEHVSTYITKGSKNPPPPNGTEYLPHDIDLGKNKSSLLSSNFFVPGPPFTPERVKMMQKQEREGADIQMSHLGRFILQAAEEPNVFYTAVFENCQREDLMKIIDDELSQCISLRRNNGRRFISGEFLGYEKLKKFHGTYLIPDNLGFLFVGTSIPDMVLTDKRLFDRLDFVILGDEKPTTCEELLQLVLSDEEKNNLLK